MAKTQVRSTNIEDGGVKRADLNTATSGSAVVTKIVQGTNITLSSTGADSGTGDVTINGGALTLTTTEVNFGTTAHRSGHFTIASTGLTSNKPVSIAQAVGPYTGKGTRFDEVEMDALQVRAKVRDATTIDVYWTSLYQVRGNYKFDYSVAA